jgi:uncharacterized protein (DUF433 family)
VLKKDYTTSQFERNETFFSAQDPRNTPSYRLSEATRYLRIPNAILMSWVIAGKASKTFLTIADRRRFRLSFVNLIEAHVLDGIRRQCLGEHLRRVVLADDGGPEKFFPFSRNLRPNDPKSFVIDPTISFGRPVLVGTGIATAAIASRFKAGESIRDLAKDYGQESPDIEEAIRWELSAC